MSIRWRLQLWHGLLLAVALAGLWLGAFFLALERRRLQADERIANAMGALMPALNPRFTNSPDRRDVRPPEGARAQFGAPEDGRCYFIAWDANGRVLGRSEHAPVKPPDRSEWPLGERSGRGPLERHRHIGASRERIRQTMQGDFILVGTSTARDAAAALRETGKLSLALVFVLGLNVAGGWWIVGRALRPIDDITSTANKIANGDLSERIDTRDTASELGTLAQVLNRTFSRLHEVFTRQARFTADASHELRTPVAVILAEARGTLSRSRSEEDYRAALDVCADTASGMGKLIDALLQLARLDSGEALPQRASTALSPLVKGAMETLQPLAAERGVTLQSELAETTAFVDPELLRQVIVNLVSNALDYTPAGGSVRIELSRDERVHLVIRDTGCGIPAEHLPRIFDRFHRVDEARTDRHFGLGLSIVKAIIDAHGGTITVESEPARGTTMRITLPPEARRSGAETRATG